MPEAYASHPLLAPAVVASVSAVAGGPLGAFVALDDRASHACGLFESVFVKLGDGEQLRAERRGLEVLRAAGVATPVALGVVDVPGGAVLVLEALEERRPEERTVADWEAIGSLLGRLHHVRGERFGSDGGDGAFGPLPQDNRPVASGRWVDFYVERRLLPMLRSAVDAGHLPPPLAVAVERVAARAPSLSGPEPAPTLLHGDAQHHNFLSTPTGAVAVDATPYYGHPEVDLALVDYFSPVAPELFRAYREHSPIDDGFDERRELWRLFVSLAAVTVGAGAPYVRRVADAVGRYR